MNHRSFKRLFLMLLFGLFIRETSHLLHAQSRTRSKVNALMPSELPNNSLVKEGWTLLWQDDFSSDTLNTLRWWAQEREDPASLCYITAKKENLFVKEGHLNIVNHKESYKGSEYTGAMVFASEKVEPNSYVEVSMKIAKGKGFWPCFWFWSGSDSTYQELDVAEYKGSRSSEFQISNHYWDEQKKKIDTQWRIVYPRNPNDGKQIDMAENFHIYGIEWLSDKVVIYMDNVPIFEITTNVPQLPMGLILSMGTGGIDGKPNRKTVFPSTLYIDYVRVYKKMG
jgi:beta-glucanase (GH16 family)